MLSFFKKLFSGGGESEPERTTVAPSAAPSGSTEAQSSATSQQDLEGFVVFVVRSLVDNPDSVVVERVEEDNGTLLQISCDKSDIGKVIGKSGRTIGAIRSLVSDASVHTNDRKVRVEVKD